MLLNYLVRSAGITERFEKFLDLLYAVFIVARYLKYRVLDVILCIEDVLLV